jgi:hypothetical protein
MALLDNLLHARDSIVIKAVPAVLAIGLVSAVVRAVTARLAKIASRLGGVLLAALLFVGGGWIASLAATQRMSLGWWCWLAVPFLLVFCLLPVQWASLRCLYRDGLRRAFTNGVAGDLDGVKWSHLRASKAGLEEPDDDRANLPELVICAASQQMGLASGGIPATSFTVSRSGVRAYACRSGTDSVSSSAGDLVDVDVYVHNVPERYRAELATVSGWMALSGAAFSSAMGRQGKGSTNALMAAFNIDLGAWIPNPWLVHCGARDFPRIRLGYLAKEILGIYDYDDQNVFVSDGGQWENLGLVELLRRRCKTIVCVDASGDTPGTFTTLSQALALASAALPFDIEITRDMTRLRAREDRLPETCVETFDFTYVINGAREPAKLLYAKLQVSADQPHEIVEFASRDRSFPTYSTANQFLSREQVEHLMSAGRAAGEQLARDYWRSRPEPAAVLQATT